MNIIWTLYIQYTYNIYVTCSARISCWKEKETLDGHHEEYHWENRVHLYNGYKL